MNNIAMNTASRSVLALCVWLVSDAALADQGNDTITIAAPWKIGALTPAESGAVLQRVGVTEPLTQPGKGGEIAGLLAESWDADESLTTWRFRIRPNVSFHDGTPLTAEVVALNLDRFAGESALRKAPVETITAEGDDVVITVSRPFAPLPAYLAHWSTGILAPAALEENATAEAIGTGYYHLSEQLGGESLTLAVFDDYWGQKPEIDKARYVYAPDDATRLAMVQSGEAELAFGLKANVASAGGDATTIHTEATPRIRALKLNIGKAPFSDLRVREAISLAIDREGIAMALLANPKTAATQLLPVVADGWHQTDLEPFGHDPARAKALLAEAGWTPGEGGVLEKDGEPFSVDFLAYDARPELPEIATAVQAQLADIGIEAVLTKVDWTAIPARHDDKTLEMAIVSDGFAYIPEPIGALAENYTKGGAAWGALDWTHAAFDKLVEDYQATVKIDDQRALRQQMMQILHEELPIITITWYDETFAVSDRIDGFSFDPYEMRYNLNEVRWSE